jgi:hypothetical protein
MDFWRDDVVIHVAGIGDLFFHGLLRFVSLVKDKNQSDEKKDQQYSDDVLKSFLAFSLPIPS